MHSFISIVAIFFASFALSAPAPQIGYINTVINETLPMEQKPTIGGGTAASYQGSLDDSQGQTFYLTVRAKDPRYDGHNVQLMPGSPASLAVVDLASPALLLTLSNGSLATVTLSDFNDPYLLGDIGGLRNVSSNATQAAQSFIFRNETSTTSTVFKQSSRGWYLLGGGHTPTYVLHQNVPSGWINGFIMCEMDNGQYFQTFYYEYTGLIPNYGDNCEFVALETTVAPYV